MSTVSREFSFVVGRKIELQRDEMCFEKLQKIMSTLCNLNVNYGFYCTIVISLCFLLKSLTSALSQEYSFSSGKNNCGSFVVMH